MMAEDRRYVRISRNYRYSAWLKMVGRCTNPNHQGWRWYGARGIKVCARWLNDFRAFVDDMGDRPSEGHSLDRIDNMKGYSPGNCRWATAAEQASNRRPGGSESRLLDGKRTADEIAAIAGITAEKVRKRFRSGYRGSDLYAHSLLDKRPRRPDGQFSGQLS